MSFQGILAIFGAIVVVAGITTVVTRPNSATIINAIGSLFTSALRTAMGR
jgi:hypothetical protein